MEFAFFNMHISKFVWSIWNFCTDILLKRADEVVVNILDDDDDDNDDDEDDDMRLNWISLNNGWHDEEQRHPLIFDEDERYLRFNLNSTNTISVVHFLFSPIVSTLVSHFRRSRVLLCGTILQTMFGACCLGIVVFMHVRFEGETNVDWKRLSV